MANVTLSYTISSTTTSRTFDALSLKGMETADQFQFVGVQHRFLNGTISENFIGFQRIIDLDLGVLQNHQDKLFLLSFFFADERIIRKGSDWAQLAKDEYDRHYFEWLQDSEIGSRLQFRVIDRYVSKRFQQGIITDNMTGYIKSHVEITGTQWSPETFTTSSGKLAAPDKGTYPAFDSSTQAIAVLLCPYQQNMEFKRTQPSVSSGNVTFQAAISDAGQAADDGKYYMDVIILVHTA